MMMLMMSWTSNTLELRGARRIYIYIYIYIYMADSRWVWLVKLLKTDIPTWGELLGISEVSDCKNPLSKHFGKPMLD